MWWAGLFREKVRCCEVELWYGAQVSPSRYEAVASDSVTRVVCCGVESVAKTVRRDESTMPQRTLSGSVSQRSQLHSVSTTDAIHITLGGKRAEGVSVYCQT